MPGMRDAIFIIKVARKRVPALLDDRRTVQDQLRAGVGS